MVAFHPYLLVELEVYHHNGYLTIQAHLIFETGRGNTYIIESKILFELDFNFPGFRTKS
jgi:hypothetical protein